MTSESRPPNDVDSLKRRIGKDAFAFTYARSPGPGGQNVNKVNSRVTLLFCIDEADMLTAWERRRIRSRLTNRINKAGVLRVVCFRHREQRRNRDSAVERFFELLSECLQTDKPRRPTKTPPRARRRRLQDKRRQGEKKQLRRRVSRDD